MLPATIGYVFLGSAIGVAEGDVAKTISYVGTGVAALILLSLAGKLIGKKK